VIAKQEKGDWLLGGPEEFCAPIKETSITISKRVTDMLSKMTTSVPKKEVTPVPALTE